MDKKRVTALLNYEVETLDDDDIEELLNLGADPCWRNYDGKSCIERAFDNENGNICYVQIKSNMNYIALLGESKTDKKYKQNYYYIIMNRLSILEAY